MSVSSDLSTPGQTTQTSSDRSPALILDDVTKVYPGVVALRDVRFDVNPGEVHALVGENGAGKSTLIGVAAGAVRPERGRVLFGGGEVADPSPARMRALGLSVVFQQPPLLPDLTVAENLVLGVAEHRRPSMMRARAWAQSQLAANRLEIDAGRRVEDLDVAERQLVEITRALSNEPTVLILDEPTEPLSQRECDWLFSTISEASARRVAVVYISHRLRDVERIADRITVLRDGEVRETFRCGELSEEEILAAIVGRPIDTAFPPKSTGDRGPTRLRVSALSGGGFSEVDLAVAGGEVVGIAGIEGNGQRDFIRALAGLEHSAGTVEIDGRPVRRDRPDAAVAAGIVYMPADRHREGILPSLSVRENVTLMTLERNAWRGVVRKGDEGRAVAEQVSEFAIRAASPETAVASLSGGNQQKTVFARTMLAQPTVVLADEPTQGVDAGARMELYRHLREAADRGAAVLVLSSDALELEGLCDRVVVFSRGHVLDQLTGAEVSEQKITGAALTSTQLRRREAATDSTGRRLRDLARSDYAPAALLALIIFALGVYTGVANPDYFAERNLTQYLLLLSALGFIALGQFVVVLLGGVDLSVGPLVGLLVVIASSAMSEPGVGLVLGVVLMLAAAAAVGATNGALIRAVKVPPVIATLVTFFVLQGISLTLRPNPGGSIDLGLSDTILQTIGAVPVAFLALIAAVIALEFALRFTRWGIELRATGSNEASAHRLGAKVDRRHIGAYVACSLLTCLGAFIVMAEVGVGDATAGTEFTLTSIAAVVLGGASIFGGRGAFVGVLAGAALLQQTTNVSTFLDLSAAWQYWFVGALTVVAAGLYSRTRDAR